MVIYCILPGFHFSQRLPLFVVGPELCPHGVGSEKAHGGGAESKKQLLLLCCRHFCSVTGNECDF